MVSLSVKCQLVPEASTPRVFRSFLVLTLQGSEVGMQRVSLIHTLLGSSLPGAEPQGIWLNRNLLELSLMYTPPPHHGPLGLSSCEHQHLCRCESLVPAARLWCPFHTC